MGQARRRAWARAWRSQHELILFGLRGKRDLSGDAQGNVIQCSRTGNINHTTEKPVDLVRTLLTVSHRASVAYDPFLGSGTTLIACEGLGRQCRGVELDPAYVAVTIQRWKDLTGKEPRLINEGQKTDTKKAARVARKSRK